MKVLVILLLTWYDYRWADIRIPRFYDAPVFIECMNLSGPGNSAPHGCLQRFDYDRDMDVDLEDFIKLQESL